MNQEGFSLLKKLAFFEFIYRAISAKTELINSSSLGTLNTKDEVVSTTMEDDPTFGARWRTAAHSLAQRNDTPAS